MTADEAVRAGARLPRRAGRRGLALRPGGAGGDAGLHRRRRRRGARPGPGAGRKPTRPRLVGGAPAAPAVAAVLAAIADGDWQALTVAEGAQGPRTYQFVARRVWESRDGLPGRAWLAGAAAQPRRHRAQGLPLQRPGRRRRCASWPRSGRSAGRSRRPSSRRRARPGSTSTRCAAWVGWHHHVTLVLLAAAFLLTIQQDWGEKLPAPHGAAGGASAARGAAPPPLDAARSCGAGWSAPKPATPAPNAPIANAAFPASREPSL